MAFTRRTRVGVSAVSCPPARPGDARRSANKLNMPRVYRSTFLLWALFMIPAGMAGINRARSLDPFFNSESLVYGVGIVLFLGWLCKTVVVARDHITVSRVAGLWKTVIPFNDMRFVGYVNEGRTYSLRLVWENGMIRIWPLTCFRQDELVVVLSEAVQSTSKELSTRR